MDYEKAYKEALERAKSMMALPDDKATMEYIFPELTETEDERIRKEILDFIQLCLSRTDFGSRSIALRKEDAEMFEKWIAYLEKPKEQKSEQSEMEKEYVRTLHSLISDFLRGKQEIDREYYQKIWDWLDNRHIEQKLSFELPKDEAYAMMNKPPQIPEKPTEWSDNFGENIRELLHNKLRWDSEDGSISTAVFIDDKTLKDIVTGIWFYVGKEALKYPSKELNVTEWSEEDEIIRDSIIEYINSGNIYATSKVNMVTWLKYLRPTWKPSEEQMDALEKASTNKYLSAKQFDILVSLYEQLKKL